MSRLLKVLFSALALVAMGILAASCGTSNSQYRIVHTVADSTFNFDISMNGASVFTNVPFLTTEPSSGYKSIGSGSDPIEVFQTGTTTNPVIASTALNLHSGSIYTVFVTGSFNNLAAYPISVYLKTDTNTAPAAGNGEFRFVHASPNAPNGVDNTNGLDIYVEPAGTGITGPPTVSALPFGSASNYVSQGADSNGTAYTIFVTPNGSTIPYITYPFTLNSGSIRTFVFVDVPGGGALSSQPMILSDLN
jgi:hypothetical protein